MFEKTNCEGCAEGGGEERDIPGSDEKEGEKMEEAPTVSFLSL